uniref:Uncharacterized protein n=1 Tax=Aegilops tauschii subsp. strangulata TaxID=200361 RepID=A0A453MQ15_AEGTS
VSARSECSTFSRREHAPHSHNAPHSLGQSTLSLDGQEFDAHVTGARGGDGERRQGHGHHGIDGDRGAEGPCCGR